MACCIETRQVMGVMAEVGVHLEDVIIPFFQGPLEAGDVGRAQTLLSRALNKEQPFGEFVVHQAFYDIGCAVRTAVVYDKNVKTFFQREDGPDNVFHVLLFVIGRDDNYRITFMHSQLSLLSCKIKKIYGNHVILCYFFGPDVYHLPAICPCRVCTCRRAAEREGARAFTG